MLWKPGLWEALVFEGALSLGGLFFGWGLVFGKGLVFCGSGLWGARSLGLLKPGNTKNNVAKCSKRLVGELD